MESNNLLEFNHQALEALEGDHKEIIAEKVNSLFEADFDVYADRGSNCFKDNEVEA